MIQTKLFTDFIYKYVAKFLDILQQNHSFYMIIHKGSLGLLHHTISKDILVSHIRVKSSTINLHHRILKA